MTDPNDATKYISEHERESLPADCFAGPNRSFPINTQAHVYAAAHLYGRAANPEKVKARIIAIARRKGFALPDGWAKDSADDKQASGKSVTDVPDQLIAFGSPIKATGEYKFGGHLVLFSKANDPDLTGDFFDGKTDFDLDDGDRRSGYYNHGLDVKIGNHKIGVGTLKRDDMGLWLEGQLKERDDYAEAVWKLLEEGALGLSSGALSHLVRREKVGKSHRITHWPIGEWSLTPTPAEPRTCAMPLKMWAAELKADTVLSASLPQDMVVAAISRLNDALIGCLYRTLYDYDDETGEYEDADGEDLDTIRAAFDEHNALGKRVVAAMLNDDEDGAKALLLDAFTGRFKRNERTFETARALEDALRDAAFSRKQAVAIVNHGFKGLLRDAGNPDEPPTPPTPHADLKARTDSLLAFAASR